MKVKRVDEEFGRELSEEFRDNRKLLWKEVTKRKGKCGGDV